MHTYNISVPYNQAIEMLLKYCFNLQVSWIRHRDVHLLTVGRYTYTNDDRFRAINRLNSNEWTLQIKYPQQRDAGVYECQISTTPHLSRFYHLNIIGKLFRYYTLL